MTFHRWYIPLYLFAIPHTVVGLLLALVYVPTSIRWSAGCIEIIPRWIAFKPAAQTHGFVIFYADEAARADADMRVHERIHVAQGLVGGPFFVLAYLTCFLYYLARFRGQGGWLRAYMEIPFERQAYRLQSRRPAWGA